MRILAQTLPAQIPGLGTNFFEHLSEDEFRILTPEQLAEMAPEQIVQMLLTTTNAFLSARLARLNPLAFRKFSATHLNRLASESSDNQTVIPQLTEEQLREVPASAFYGIKEIFFNFLKPRQLASLTGDQISEIHPKIFKKAIFLPFLINLNQDQIQRFTANQLREIPTSQLRQLADFFSLVQNKNFFGLLTRAQLSWLTPDQMDSSREGVKAVYFILHCRAMPKAWVQRITRQELDSIPPVLFPKLGTDFLNQLTEAQIAGFTASQKETLAAEGIRLTPSPELVETPRQKYLQTLSSDEITQLGPLFPTDLNDNEIALLNRSQLSGMTPLQIEIQNAGFFRCLAVRQLSAFDKNQLQAIRPSVLSELGVNDFWVKILPLPEQLRGTLDPYSESLSSVEFRSILKNLTKEQVAQIPVRIFQEMGDDFMLNLDAASFSKIPAEAFRYVRPYFAKNITPEQIRQVTPEQVVRWAPDVFSELNSHQVIQLTPPVCQALTVEQLSQCDWGTLLAIPAHQLNPQIFAAAKGDYLVRLSPEAFSLLSSDHLNALANSPEVDVVRNDGNLVKSHPIFKISKEQLGAILPQVIHRLNKEFFQKLSLEQFDWLQAQQYQAISGEVVSSWEESLDPKGTMFYNKTIEEGIASPRLVHLEQSPQASPNKRQRVEGESTVTLLHSGAANIQERRAVVVVVSENVLRTSDPTDIRKAVESLLRKRPETEFYALCRDANGQFQRWRFEDASSTDWPGKWSTLPHSFRLEGEYDKITLLAHGDDERKILSDIEYEDVGSRFADLLIDLTRIDHISILACGVLPTFGVRLYQQIAEERARGGGVIALLRNTLPNRITGSKLWTYVMGNSEEDSSTGTHIPAGSRVYEDKDNQIKHGTKYGKWQVKRGPDGLMVTVNLPTHGDGRIVYPGEWDAGPFGYARLRQEITKAKQEISESMNALEAMAKKIRDQIDSYQLENPNWVAVLDRANQEGEKYFIPIVETTNSKFGKIQLSPDEERTFLAAQARLKPAYETLRPYLRRSQTGQLQIGESVAAGGEKPGSTNGAFFAMALIEYLHEKQCSPEIQLSVYWNLAGMATATMGDGVEFGKLVSQLASPGGTAETSLQIVSKIFRGANLAFQAGSMGWDLYQLITTKDPSTRLGTAIQFGFTSGAVVLQGGTMLLGALAPTVAATASAFGELAGPFMALGFGFSALGVQIQQNNAGVHSLLNYFIEFEKACRSGGFTKSGDLLIPQPAAAITRVDFEKGKVAFENPQVLKSVEAKGAIQYLSGAAPHLLYIPGTGYQWFGLREELGIQETADLEDVPVVLLPYTPNLAIYYGYSDVAPKLSSEEKEIANRLRLKGDFAPSNSWGNLRAGFTSEKKTVFQETKINVKLGQKTRVCWLSPIIDENVSYEIEGKGGQYAFRGLHSGVRMRLKEEAEEASSFLLEITESELLGMSDVALSKGILTIQDKEKKSIRINVGGLHSGSKIRVVGKAASWNVNLFTGEIRLSALDLRNVPQLNVKDYLGKVKNCAENIVILTKGTLPSPINSQADTEEKIIYQKNLQSAEETATRVGYDVQAQHPIDLGLEEGPLLFGSNLVGITDKNAFFFNKSMQILWCTDRLTNKVIRNYQLRFATPESRIENVIQVNGEVFVKQMIPENGREVVLLHVLKEDKIQLVQIRNLDRRLFDRFVNFPKDLFADIEFVRREGDESYSSRNFLEVLARQLPWRRREEYLDLPSCGAEIAAWMSIGSEDNHLSVLVNLQNAYRISMRADQADYGVVKSWSYPPSIGGMGLVLWSPVKRTVQFVKLAPNDINPAIVSYAASYADNGQKRDVSGRASADLQPLELQTGKLTFGANPHAKFHSLLPEKRVIPFEQFGEIYLVTEDGQEIFMMNQFGALTSLQYSYSC